MLFADLDRTRGNRSPASPIITSAAGHDQRRRRSHRRGTCSTAASTNSWSRPSGEAGPGSRTALLERTNSAPLSKTTSRTFWTRRLICWAARVSPRTGAAPAPDRDPAGRAVRPGPGHSAAVEIPADPRIQQSRPDYQPGHGRILDPIPERTPRRRGAADLGPDAVPDRDPGVRGRRRLSPAGALKYRKAGASVKFFLSLYDATGAFDNAVTEATQTARAKPTYPVRGTARGLTPLSGPRAGASDGRRRTLWPIHWTRRLRPLSRATGSFDEHQDRRMGPPARGRNADHRARCLGWTDYEVTP